MWLAKRQSLYILPCLLLSYLLIQSHGLPLEFRNGTTTSSLIQLDQHQQQEEEPHPVFDINGQSAEEEHRPSHFEILSLDWHHVETVSNVPPKQNIPSMYVFFV